MRQFKTTEAERQYWKRTASIMPLSAEDEFILKLLEDFEELCTDVRLAEQIAVAEAQCRELARMAHANEDRQKERAERAAIYSLDSPSAQICAESKERSKR